MNKQMKLQEQQEAIANLKTWIKPNSKLIIVITTVASSGMSRRMRVYLTNGKNKSLSNMTYNISKACDMQLNDNGLLVSGCGMDMCFWLADHITYYLGYKNKKALTGNGGSCLDWQAIY